MSPTRDPDSTQGHPPQPNQPDQPSPIPLRPRTPRTGRLRALQLALRRPHRPRPSTVWPCAQDDNHETAGLIATWLLTAIVKIVTTYTQPGQRVLLLTPTPFPTSQPTAGVRAWIAPGPYAGLHEAGWTVVRLGRGIQTHTAGPPRDTNNGGRRHVVDPNFESESGPRPRPASSASDAQRRSIPDSHPDPDRTATVSGPDRFDLVVTAAEPRVLGWLRPADWATVLTPTGTLAVITRCDRSRGLLDDPAGSLVTAAHRAGLRYHDRIALLRTPIHNGALAVGAAGSYGLLRPPHRPVTTAVRHTQIHDDLLVFTREPAPTTAADREESSDV